MRTSEQTDKLWPAVVKARQAMKGPKKDSQNPHFKSKYADLSECIDAADVAGGPHGLVTLQEPSSDSAGVSVSTIIVHESGQWVQFDPLFIPASKSDAQGFGSAVSYARRYSIKAAWNMADEDDDGNAAVKAGQPKKATASIVPEGYDEWLDDLRSYAASGVTKAEFRDTYGKSKPEHRKYLETNNRPTLDALLAKFAGKAA